MVNKKIVFTCSNIFFIQFISLNMEFIEKLSEKAWKYDLLWAWIFAYTLDGMETKEWKKLQALKALQIGYDGISNFRWIGHLNNFFMMTSLKHINYVFCVWNFRHKHEAVHVLKLKRRKCRRINFSKDVSYDCTQTNLLHWHFHTFPEDLLHWLHRHHSSLLIMMSKRHVNKLTNKNWINKINS